MSPGQHSWAQEGPSLGTLQEHYKGQEDPACLFEAEEEQHLGCSPSPFPLSGLGF